MRTILTPLVLALGLASCAAYRSQDMLAPDFPRALPAQGRVQVSWIDPAQMTEIRHSPNRYAAARGDWLLTLARYLRQRADALLPAGHTLEVRILDIDRAGEFEPWLIPPAPDIRVIRDIYPPRMTVHYVLRDSSGAVLAEDERNLTDPAYLIGTPPLNDSDPLRYEKRMIDSWLRQQFARHMAER